MSESVDTRKRRQLKRRIWAFAILHLLIAIHLVAWYLLDWRAIGAIDMQELFRNFIEKNVLTAGAVFFLGLIALTLLWGRIFCGWWCHIGQAYDLIAAGYRRLGIRMHGVPLRFGTWMAAFVLIWFFLREAVLHRVAGPNPELTVAMGEVAPWELLPGWVNGTITLAVVLFLLPVMFGPRPFCRYLCPWGVVLGAANRFSRYKVRRTGDCTMCGACSPACPMDIDVSRAINTGNLSVNALQCTNCMQCVAACPTEALSFEKPGRQNREKQRHPFLEGLAYPPLGIELVFWAMVLAVGLVYSELYGIGIFLAFCFGLVLARLTLLGVARFRSGWSPRALATGLVLLLLWLGVGKDAVAKHQFRAGFEAMQAGEMRRARDHFERSDRLLWVTPDVLLLNLHRIYLVTGEDGKRERNAQRFDDRQRRRGRLEARED